METFNLIIPSREEITPAVELVSTGKAFIEANTLEMSMRELRDEHIIPVFSTTNEPLISHHEFIDTVRHVVKNWYHDEVVLEPNIRVSHPIKGRIPEAKYKKAHELFPWEQTLYYERMMFIIEVPTIMHDVNGNKLTLTIGGVKSFNNDNLYGKRPSGEQSFQMFIGFKNMVCCNMCVSTDGLKSAVKIKSLNELQQSVEELLHGYDLDRHLALMRHMNNIHLNENEFAQFIGKSRLYKFLPDKNSMHIQPLEFGDQQMGAVVKDFYNDVNFSSAADGTISLWRLFNLLTGVNKSTYIDNFLDRACNASEIVLEIAQHKAELKNSWFLQ
jgi:hypothetical protein